MSSSQDILFLIIYLFDSSPEEIFAFELLHRICSCVYTTIWMQNVGTEKAHRQKVEMNYTRMLRAVLNKCCKQQPRKTAVVRPPATLLTSHSAMRGTDGEARTNTSVTLTRGFLYMNMPVVADQQILTFVWTLNSIWKTCQVQWTIGMDRERERGEREKERGRKRKRGEREKERGGRGRKRGGEGEREIEGERGWEREDERERTRERKREGERERDGEREKKRGRVKDSVLLLRLDTDDD